MQTTRQQQIVVYFIEEAKEHLDTIEQGLLSLKATIADSERMNELFRAAHSVKGGAAMLGFSSIQKVGHYLEDCFKLLKEHAIEIDQTIENFFFQCFDILKGLVEELQSPYGLREAEADQTVQSAEPTFLALQTYLTRQVASSPAPLTPKSQAKPELAARLNVGLKKMLLLFKQGDTHATRKQLIGLCTQLTQLDSCLEWCALIQATQSAIANLKTPFQTLAPLVIRELKQAGDLLAMGDIRAIAPSNTLLRLAPTPKIPESARPEAARSPQSITVPSITVPREPRAAARALLKSFSKAELLELTEFLMQAIQ